MPNSKIPASIANMERVKDGDQRVCAYSPYTGETYSANPADYWGIDPSVVLQDDDGNDMMLVRKYEVIENVELA